MDKITKNKTIIDILNSAYNLKRATTKWATRLTILLLLDQREWTSLSLLLKWLCIP